MCLQGSLKIVSCQYEKIVVSVVPVRIENGWSNM